MNKLLTLIIYSANAFIYLNGPGSLCLANNSKLLHAKGNHGLFSKAVRGNKFSRMFMHSACHKQVYEAVLVRLHNATF